MTICVEKDRYCTRVLMRVRTYSYTSNLGAHAITSRRLPESQLQASRQQSFWWKLYPFVKVRMPRAAVTT
jgi:hypothetical protein